MMTSTAAATHPNLTRDEARARANRVRCREYHIELSFESGASTYEGWTRVCFDVVSDRDGIFLDFVTRTIHRLEINGTELPPACWTGTRVELPAELLDPGANELIVRYTSGYDRTSVGLHHFADPADGGETLYTDFEPFEAHRVFPCFDQPDLKARFHWQVVAPADWVVVSNMPLARQCPEGERRRHVFEATPPISTYLANVSAGHYAVWEDERARIPSRVLARRSLASHVDPEEIFRVTRDGLDHYERTFAIPYPFPKYDQVFVPEFKSGAMENVGAVVIADLFIFRHRPTAEESLDRIVLLLHEMAHMWFGNLVTMRWWDGLWLNESFATYMSFVAAADQLGPEPVWQFFDSRIRQWAVWQDELPTTHPIEMDVPETQGCFANFDGITYGKGCCVLRQLAHRIGEERFRQGVSSYLTRHAWASTSNRDFIEALARSAGEDLLPWGRQWLETSGLNVFEAVLETSDGRVTDLTIRQDPGNGDATLREHRIRVALFDEGPEGIRRSSCFEVLLAGPSVRVPGAVGSPAPVFVHPNEESFGYGKVRLDPRSLETLRAGIVRFRERLDWSRLLDIALQMVHDGELRVQEVLEMSRMVIAELAASPDPMLADDEPARQLLDAQCRAVPALLHRYLDREDRATRGRVFHDLAFEILSRGRTGRPAGTSPGDGRGGGSELSWARLLIGASVCPGSLDRVEGLLSGSTRLAGLEMGQKVRWDLLACLMKQRPDEDRVRSEEELDPTDRGRRRALAIRASMPVPRLKESLWRRFLDDEATSLDLLRVAFSAFHQPDQEALLAPFAFGYLEELPRISRDRDPEFSMAFAEDLFPEFCEDPIFRERVADRVEDGSLPAAIRRGLIERRHELEKLVRTRRLSRSGPPDAMHAGPGTHRAVRRASTPS